MFTSGICERSCNGGIHYKSDEDSNQCVRSLIICAPVIESCSLLTTEELEERNSFRFAALIVGYHQAGESIFGGCLSVGESFNLW